jgi:hypothetical protein
MKNRCYNKNSEAYHNYGGRGINVSDEWHDFEAFYKDMGDKPEGLTLERVDNDAGYSKDNCVWASRKAQVRNSRRAKLTEDAVSDIKKLINEGSMLQKEIAGKYGVSRIAIGHIASEYRWKDIAPPITRDKFSRATSLEEH